MAKKSKDTTTTTTKTKKPADPAAIRNLERLLNTLALLLAIAAFLLQLFAVLTHSWKYQVTNLQPLVTAADRSGRAYAPEDSRLDQSYGLFSRKVKLYANNDEQLDVCASTRFPRLDNGDDELHQCLAKSTTLRGSLLTCNQRLNSPETCHCRRYPHWNATIFFEIAALVLLGLLVVVIALFVTHFRNLLKPVAAGLAFLAFLFLLIGLILLLSYLKRETRNIADTYPHVYSRLGNQVNQRYQSVLHKAVRREAHETYRAYSLQPGQHPYNETHYQQYSEQRGAWVYYPYSSASSYAPHSKTATQQSTNAPLRNAYGPVFGYDQVYDNTRARIGCSAVLSILATILSLLLPLLLAYSLLLGKKIPAEQRTVTTTTTTYKTEYVPVAGDVTVETVPLTQPTHVRDVVITSEQPTATATTHRT